jgi:hypothetical protein
MEEDWQRDLQRWLEPYLEDLGSRTHRLPVIWVVQSYRRCKEISFASLGVAAHSTRSRRYGQVAAWPAGHSAQRGG